MRLINTDEAIKDLEEHVDDLCEVIKSYKILIKNLKKVTGTSPSRQGLYYAGFTDEQINKFIEIMFKD